MFLSFWELYSWPTLFLRSQQIIVYIAYMRGILWFCNYNVYIYIHIFYIMLIYDCSIVFHFSSKMVRLFRTERPAAKEHFQQRSDARLLPGTPKGQLQKLKANWSEMEITTCSNKKKVQTCLQLLSFKCLHTSCGLSENTLHHISGLQKSSPIHGLWQSRNR